MPQCSRGGAQSWAPFMNVVKTDFLRAFRLPVETGFRRRLVFSHDRWHTFSLDVTCMMPGACLCAALDFLPSSPGPASACARRSPAKAGSHNSDAHAALVDHSRGIGAVVSTAAGVYGCMSRPRRGVWGPRWCAAEQSSPVVRPLQDESGGVEGSFVLELMRIFISQSITEF
jgi:hypothetical protein